MNKVYLKNTAGFTLQINVKEENSDNLHLLSPGAILTISEDQMSNDIKLKIRKKLLSNVEKEREKVFSAFTSEPVEPEIPQTKPLSHRGRKKKLV